MTDRRLRWAFSLRAISSVFFCLRSDPIKPCQCQRCGTVTRMTLGGPAAPRPTPLFSDNSMPFFWAGGRGRTKKETVRIEIIPIQDKSRKTPGLHRNYWPTLRRPLRPGSSSWRPVRDKQRAGASQNNKTTKQQLCAKLNTRNLTMFSIFLYYM